MTKTQENKQDANVETKEEVVKETEKVDNRLYTALNEQVQLLKDQNQELHSMLQSLQSRDKGAAQEKPELLKLREEVAQAVQENSRLRAMMDDIKVNREMDIRQQINDLQMENQDLRVEIGRLRYSQFKQQDVPSRAAAEPTPKAAEAETEESSKGLFNKWPEVNWTELVNHLGSTGQGKKLEELGESLSQLLRDLWELNTTLFPPEGSDKAQTEDEAREEPLKEIEMLLVSKWKELQGMLSMSKGYVSRHAEGMSRLLATSMNKVYKAGVKVLFGDPHRETLSVSSLQPQLQKIMSKMGKVMTSLEDKWNKMKRRLSSEQQFMEKADELDDEADDEVLVEEEEKDTPGQWVFQRAKDREQTRGTVDSKFYEDWYTLRAKNRKKQRQEQEQGKNVNCRDGKRCKKNFKKQDHVTEESSDDAWENDLPKHTFKESRGY